MRNFLSRLSEISANVCGWLLMVLMALLFLDIVCRTVGYPILGVAEISMCVMLTTVYLGLANCEVARGHVKVEFLTERMSPRMAKWVAVFTGILSIFTLAVCSWAMTMNAIDSYTGDEAMAGLVPIPVWPIKAIMAAGIILYLLATLLNFSLNLRELRDRRPDAGA